MNEELEEKLKDDRLTDQDRNQIRAFDRFLRQSDEWPRDEDGRRIVPAEWVPYVKGEGPAP